MCVCVCVCVCVYVYVYVTESDTNVRETATERARERARKKESERASETERDRESERERERVRERERERERECVCVCVRKLNCPTLRGRREEKFATKQENNIILCVKPMCNPNKVRSTTVRTKRGEIAFSPFGTCFTGSHSSLPIMERAGSPALVWVSV